GRSRFVLMKNSSPDDVSHECAREEPCDAKKDDESAKKTTVQDERFQRIVVNAREYEGQLKTDQDEDEAIDRECEGVPETVRLDADARRKELVFAATQIEATSYDSEHAR